MLRSKIPMYSAMSGLGLLPTAPSVAAKSGPKSHKVVIFTQYGTNLSFAAVGDGKGKEISTKWNNLRRVDVRKGTVFTFTQMSKGGAVHTFKLGGDNGVKVSDAWTGVTGMAVDGGVVTLSTSSGK